MPFFLEPGAWDEESLKTVEAKLEDTPCRVTRKLSEGFFPDQKTKELLAQKWG